MPLALRGAAAVPTGNPTTGFTVAVPSQVLANDLLFLLVASRDSVNAGTLAVTDNDTGGNAWAKIGNSTDHKLTLWWKRATGATASKTVTVANAVGSSSGVLECFSGGSLGATPYANIAVDTNASGDEAQNSFTPSQPNSMVCAGVVNYANDNAVTSLSFATLGATTATEKLSTGGSDCGCIFGHRLQSGNAAATGNLTWAQTDGTTYSIVWTIVPEMAGTLNGTLDALSAAASGVVAVVGQLAATLAIVTVAGAATIPIQATSTTTLASIGISAEGEVAGAEATGDLDVTLAALTVSASAAVPIVGLTDTTLGTATLDGTAVVPSVGSLTATLGAVASSGTAAVSVQGSSDVSLAPLELSSQAAIPVNGSLAVDLEPLQVSANGSGVVETTGTLSNTLGALALSASGTLSEAEPLGVLTMRYLNKVRTLRYL